MNAPQVIVIIMLATRALLAALLHGHPFGKGSTNAFIHWIIVAVWALLLWWGGFWS